MRPSLQIVRGGPQPPLEILPLNKDVTLLAFDPGDTTGVCAVREGRCCYSAALSLDEIMGLVSNCSSRAFENSDLGPFWFQDVDVMVIERWSLYPNMVETMMHSEFIPVQIIGMLRALAYALDIPVIYQTANAAQTLIPNERLDLYGWKLRGDHQRDAARHAIYYLATAKS